MSVVFPQWSIYPNLKLIVKHPHSWLMKNRKLSAYFFSRSHSLPFYWLSVCALSHWEAFLNVTLTKSSNNSLLFFPSVTGYFLLHGRSITLHSLCRLGKNILLSSVELGIGHIRTINYHFELFICGKRKRQAAMYSYGMENKRKMVGIFEQNINADFSRHCLLKEL